MARTVGDAFLEAICEAPEDDAPRLIYADWLDEHGHEARAEFIRTQCALAATPADDLRYDVLAIRAWNLWQANHVTWDAEVARIVGHQSYGQYHRGFIAFVEMTAEAFLRHAPALFVLTPLRCVEIREMESQTLVSQLEACPELKRLTAIDLPFGCSGIGDQGMRHLAGMPNLLSRLRSFYAMESSFTPSGLRTFLRSPHLGGLQRFSLHDCHIWGEEGVAAITAAPPSLICLSLDACEVGNDGLRMLVEAPARAGLEYLALTQGWVNARGIAGCDLSYAQIIQLFEPGNDPAGRKSLL